MIAFQASAGPDVDGENLVGKEAVKKTFEDIFKNYPDAKWNNVGSCASCWAHSLTCNTE